VTLASHSVRRRSRRAFAAASRRQPTHTVTECHPNPNPNNNNNNNNNTTSRSTDVASGSAAQVFGVELSGTLRMSSTETSLHTANTLPVV